MSDRDLLRALSLFVGTIVETHRDVLMLSKRVRQIMTRKPITLQPDADVTEAIQLLLTHPISCVPIVDTGSRPVGIVSWRDVPKACAAARVTGQPTPAIGWYFLFEPDMNDKRRKIIHAQRRRLEALKVKVEELKAEAESIRGELETVRDDEQEAFDRMSASQQSGERGESAEASIDNLDTAISVLDEIEDLSDLVEAIEALDNAENG